MNNKERAAMQQAIHKINQATAFDEESDELLMEALAALREALDHSGEATDMAGCSYCNNPLFAGRKCNNCGREAEQAEQEPVAYAGMIDGSVCAVYTQWLVSHYHKIKPLYTAPVRTKDLTDDEIEAIMVEQGDLRTTAFARTVIATDREKNRG